MTLSSHSYNFWHSITQSLKVMVWDSLTWPPQKHEKSLGDDLLPCWPCDLFWPMECGRSDSVTIPSLGLKRVLTVCSVAKFWLANMWLACPRIGPCIAEMSHPRWLQMHKVNWAQKNHPVELTQSAGPQNHKLNQYSLRWFVMQQKLTITMGYLRLCEASFPFLLWEMSIAVWCNSYFSM